MNIINAIINLINNPIMNLQNHNSNRNRANSMGDALEEYVKDLFANTFNCTEIEKLEKVEKTFSYLGNSSNPPDALLFNGDAIEVKKIEANNSTLALNSSYPKQKLYSSSPMISSACRKAESWTEKDVIYITGVAHKNTLKHLSFVYGMDYAAEDKTYSRIKNTIKQGIEDIPDVEFSETKELGRVNKVDPLGITYLRVRGMWGIENPWTVFNYIYNRDLSKDFNFMCIINEEKWRTFNNYNELLKLSNEISDLKIKDVKIKNPDNPAQLRPAKLITFSR